MSVLILAIGIPYIPLALLLYVVGARTPGACVLLAVGFLWVVAIDLCLMHDGRRRLRRRHERVAHVG